MEKLQYDSFYKFLVSLGIIIIMVPVFIFYYLISNGNDILITKSEYLELTEESIKILVKRENIIEFFLILLPYISLFLMILGISFLIYGGMKWKKLQKEIDEQTRLKTIEQQVNISKMTTTEVLKKKIKDIKEIENESTKSDKVKLNKNNYFIKSIETEDFYYYNVFNKLQNNYDVHQNVKIGNVDYDIIATSKNNNEDYLFEIKYWRQTPSFNTFIRSLKDFEVRGLEYKKMLSREYKSIFAIIIPLDNFEKVKNEIEKYLDNNSFSNIEIEFNREIVMEYDNDLII